MHLHSTFSDGRNRPEEIVERAILMGYKTIAIVDHVRRTSNWLDQFATEIERLKQAYAGRINLYSGIEAKVINLKGGIDAMPEFYAKVDLVLGAFHRIPKGQEEYLSDQEIALCKAKALSCWFEGMMGLLENPHVDIIAHPTAILKRKGISVTNDMACSIARKAAGCNKVFEVNSKYQVPEESFLNLLRLNGVKLSFGSDSHGIEEM